ncbi:hypothetical protein [Phenylobacterium sp. SCN 70-31]|uniref:hypothetical protein n=1 Tax=Phenylobacterium sp. SCN 70-31 TaxID=1660129 RepID=UPI0008683ADE|nr:hypothetical protein [Phenylobacterium sp. SCN 70-31]ODT87962.1 MAG: hypothetical protein ABS78_08635 [Phenylobacterium sp. SCN 70-31]
MTESPDEQASSPDEQAPRDETPMQRALRLKKAAQDSGRGGPPGRARGDGEREAAARSQSKSKPWMKR